MRMAILSDIHGNSIALDAVLRDIEARGGVDVYWILGDFAALGPDPAGSISRVRALPNAGFTRGNTDRYVVDASNLAGAEDAVREKPARVQRFIDVARNFAWTRGAVGSAGYFDWLSELPLDVRLTLPDDTRLLGVHAAPGTDDGRGLRPDADLAEKQAFAQAADADIVFVGHTHWAQDYDVDGVRLVNLGSVSNQFKGSDPRASYVLLEADAESHQLQHCLVDYDHEAVIALAEASGHPAHALIASFMRGEVVPPWATG
jgi:putative phosphoesterase